MKKLQQYKYIIPIVVLLAIGVVLCLCFKTSHIAMGFAFVCWGVALAIFTFMNKQKSDIELKAYDDECNEVIIDIQAYGENSEYFGVVNLDTINKNRKKLVKKHKKQLVSCGICSAILIIIGIICMF